MNNAYYFPINESGFLCFGSVKPCGLDMKELRRLAEESFDPFSGEYGEEVTFPEYWEDFMTDWEEMSEDEIKRWGYYDSDTGVLVEGTGADEDEDEEE